MGQSFLSKLYTYSPLNHLGHGKQDPIGNSIFGNYSTTSLPYVGPGAYGGQQATLAGANAGYLRNAAGTPAPGGTTASLGNLFGTQKPPVSPVQRPVGGLQPPAQPQVWGT